ncbi:alpha/beta fold hydrolase [Pseudomarimonas arenosa]|uniref:Alpha/beta hydrolase n=1 Tax=Pseudomarimonas arenosa TaxID=2774145 RepID=A0AAW3ZT13_9GAMM|nr:alpha/beta hydrolase [Pseudomarimonas arenosa]MBD8527965.1 alpha/beta hydrolase [Pseudomarimonas arenosa]
MPLIDIGDCRLFVRAYGAGPPLLLIHGLGSSGDDWAFQLPAWSRQFQLIVPDLRGCGRSERPPGSYSIAGFAADLASLLDRLAIQHCAVVGFSMGGAVALELALQQPQRISRLVTINSLPSYRVDHWRKALEYHVQMALVRVLGMRRSAALIGKRLFPHPAQQAMRERVIEVIGGSLAEPYLRCARALADWCAADRLHQRQSPMLMLAGEFDYTGLEEKRRWAQQMAAQIRVVAGSRHGTPFDAIQATNRCIEAFLCDAELPDGLSIDAPHEVPREPPASPQEVLLSSVAAAPGEALVMP